MKGWKRREGDRTKPGFKVVTQNEIFVHPGLNVSIERRQFCFEPWTMD
jgi:hypothetical protein